jgi:lipoyl-dependent peroxiredoxin
MATRKATAKWTGSLKEGTGQLDTESGALSVPYDWRSRFEVGEKTNPEELVGAAHAGCFSMFVSALLSAAGTPPESIHTTATVHLERDATGPYIPKIELVTKGRVPGIDAAKFQEITEAAKAKCPISRALGAVAEITLHAELVT